MIKDICAQTDLALETTYNLVNGFYFIAAYTDSGTRFYSESISTFDRAEKIFDKYVGVVSYFSGGSVTMYQINNDDYDIIAYVHV